MTMIAFILLLLSACVHASWNLMAKGRELDVDAFLWSLVIFAVALSPCLLIWPAVTADLLPLWPWLLATGASQALYYIALVKAYQHGEMSSAYPLIRALPILMMAALVFVLQQDGWQTTPLLAICLVTGGCLLICLCQGTKRMSAVSLLWAAVAACGVTGYHWVDDHCLRLLGDAHPAASITMVYAAGEWIAASSALICAAFVCRQGLKRRPRLSDATVGLGVFVSYGLALAAMPLCDNVAWAVAFRQLSIPVGAVLGIVALGESASPKKIAGLLCISCGLLWAGFGQA